MVRTRVSIRIDLGSGRKIASDKIALLEAIQTKGSISGAARSLGMSYRSAWLWVEAINKALRAPAVAAEPGGRNGGGAALTPVGTELVELYRAIEGHANVTAVTERGAFHRLARSEKMPEGAGPYDR